MGERRARWGRGGGGGVARGRVGGLGVWGMAKQNGGRGCASLFKKGGGEEGKREGAAHPAAARR